MDALADLVARISELIDSLASMVTDSPVTYLVIFALCAIDPLLPILPAEAAVTAASVLAGQGQLSILAVMLAAGLGAFVGDNVVYWIGRSAGRPLVDKVLRGRTDRLEVVEERFRRSGGVLIVIGRFIPGGRTAVAVSAGVLHFSWPRFLAWDAFAAVIWAFQAALPGYIGGVVVEDRPWLAMIVGFGLSLLLGTSIALGHRWWEGRQVAPRGSAVGAAAAEATADEGPGDAVDGDPAAGEPVPQEARE
jgi:membrane protein DedA with SNARE-associated domain